MKTHVLKTCQPYFDAVRSGAKTFEVRVNDRDFQVGDRLMLKEWDSEGDRFTEQPPIILDITYLLNLREYLGAGNAPDVVVIGFVSAG